jgi:hypothetical protein
MHNDANKFPQSHPASRRHTLRIGLAVGIGVASLASAGRLSAQPAKLAKDAVKYTDSANLPGKDCDDCSQYIAGNTDKDPATCKIVEGSISPHGHCMAFSPKPKN